jgi:hypothetical protein
MKMFAKNQPKCFGWQNCGCSSSRTDDTIAAVVTVVVVVAVAILQERHQNWIKDLNEPALDEAV